MAHDICGKKQCFNDLSFEQKWAFCWETFHIYYSLITISVVGQKIRHYFVMSQKIVGKPRTVEAAIEPHPSIVAQALNMFLLSLFVAFRANEVDPVLRKDKHPEHHPTSGKVASFLHAPEGTLCLDPSSFSDCLV